MAPLSHGLLALGLVAMVVMIAYGASAPDIGVAEFAPAARQSVEPPPTSTGDQRSAGGAGRRTTTTRPEVAGSDASSGSAATTPGPTTLVGRGRPCYGEPPRQLPDPRSPACMATVFQGDNGGATSVGVSPTEIRVAWPVRANADQTHRIGVKALFEYVNRHFEFYGRRLVPVFVEYGSLSDVTAQRAFATQLAAQGVFAALEREPDQRWYPSFFQELARQQVVTIALNAHSMLTDRDMFDELHPYLWSVYPSVEQSWANIADFACTALVGREASHAGSSLQGQTRKFGIFAAAQQRIPPVRALQQALTNCGAQVTVGEYLSSSGNSTQISTAMQRFKNEGVTTLICACADNINTSAVSFASSNGMGDAEWVMPLFTRAELDEYYVSSVAPAQRNRLFGLQPHPKVLPFQARWWFVASQEVDPAIGSDPGTYYWGQTLYDELLVLASGIQAAGPTLTPDTFGAGMMSATFANTGAGAAPYFQPSVGFGPGDHSFYNDYALVWWSDAAEYQGHNAPAGQNKGSWCYLEGGRRYQVGSFPADADSRFFTEAPCR